MVRPAHHLRRVPALMRQMQGDMDRTTPMLAMVSTTQMEDTTT